MKKFLLFLLFIILIGGGYFAYQLYFSSGKRLNPLHAIPSDAAYLLEFDDPLEAWNDFSGSSVWAHLKTTPFLSDVTKYADSLNEVVTNNQALSKLVASRPVLLSGHPVRGDLEYFWVVDLKKTSQLLGFKNLLIPIFENFYTISVRDYHGYEILEMYDEVYRETMYMALIDNLMIGSYRHTLVEASLDQIAEPTLGRNLDFIEVKEELGYRGMFRLYLQWDILLSHVSEYFTDNTTLDELQSIFKFTGFDLDYDTEDETILLKGYTSMDDTVSSFYNMFHNTGSASITIPRVAPSSTAFYTGFGFKNQEALSSYINEMLNSDEEYTKSKKKVESFLDISVEEHFFSWMDNEMAAIQTHIDRKDNSGYALIIKANDGDDAREKLAYVGERIRKKTPVKFKQIAYRDHEINYMSISGLFRLVFGNLFQKLEKPYYTIIDDFVIFSNHPGTLRTIIDQYLDGNTLNDLEGFQEYRNKYPSESGIFLYTNAAYLLEDSKVYMDTETHKSIIKASDYILCFPMSGLHLKADDGNYEILMAIKFDKSAVYDDPEILDVTVAFAPSDSARIDSLFRAALEIEKEEEPINPDEIFPDDLDAKKYQEFFDDGALRIEVNLKNGLKHGTYLEYSQEGHIILKGNFRDDQRDGLWKEYNENGKVINRTRYRNGKAQ